MNMGDWRESNPYTGVASAAGTAANLSKSYGNQDMAQAFMWVQLIVQIVSAVIIIAGAI